MGPIGDLWPGRSKIAQACRRPLGTTAIDRGAYGVLG